MKILYNHRTRGKGAESVHIRGIVGGLRELGHEVMLLSLPGAECEKTTSESSSAKIWKFISLRLPEVIFEVLEISYNIASFVRLWIIVRRQKIDFIYERYALFNFAGIAISKIYKIPIFLEINDISTLKRVRKLKMKKLAKWLENIIFKKAEALITISNYFKNHIIERGINGNKIWVSPNAVDPELFNPNRYRGAEIREKHNLNGKVVIGFVGRFEKWHGIDLLLSCIPDIYQRHKNVNFLLVGGGSDGSNEILKQYMKEKDVTDAVTFPGWVSHSAIPSYIAAMDIAIIPNSNSYGSPMKLFEYMAMGKAVIAPRLGPVEDIAEDGENACMFKAEDKEAFCDTLLDLIINKEKRQRVGINARKKVITEHTWRNNAEKIIEICRSIKR